jgi:hypothetical protein
MTFPTVEGRTIVTTSPRMKILPLKATSNPSV